MLRAVGAALARDGGTDAVLQACCQALVDELGAVFARIWTLGPGEATLHLRASAGMYTRLNGTFARVVVGELKIGQIASEQRPHMTNDVAGDPRIEDPEWARREGMVAFAGHPLVVDGRLVGVMALFARETLAASVLEELGSIAATIAQFIGREQAATAERRRLARELHDTVSQAIYGITLAAQSGKGSLKQGRDGVDDVLDSIIELSDGAQAQMRALLFELQPESLDSEGLVPAIAQLAAAFAAQGGFAIHTELGVEPAIPGAAKLDLYRICREALNNVLRHASATDVWVRLTTGADGGYSLEVADEGQGFNAGAERPGHFGLATMSDRAAARGWSLDVASEPGSGSRVLVNLPADHPDHPDHSAT